MRVYHFLKRGYGLDAIRDRRLKIARLNNLNDPFEFFSFSMRKREDRLTFEHWRDDMSNDHGLLCFSERSDNPVQWSHYGANHSGVCLGFDISDNLLLKVKYRSKRGTVDVQALVNTGGPAEERMMRDALSTKYIHWRYEHEQRLFVGLDHSTITPAGLYFADFGPNLVLREVIVGAKSEINRAEVAEALGDMAEVETFKARLAYQTFRVVKNQNPKLWK
jgi:hypothetical protein